MKEQSGRRHFLKQLSTIPAAAAVPARLTGGATAQKQEESPVTDEIFAAGEAMDTLQYSVARYDAITPAMTFKAASRAEAVAWQRQVRRKLAQLLGDFPAQRGPLRSRVLRTEQMDGYRREQILFWSRPALQVFGYLLVPDSFRAPGAAMICLPGHGRGVDDIVGIDKDGKQRKRYGGYQNDFALQCVSQGFAAFAIEQLGFGHRRDDAARKASAERSSCQPAAGAAFMLGETMAGWRTWDVIRAIDYLESRNEIDSKRIGCMGISGGGTVTLYAAAVEPRIKVAFLSGSFCTFRHSIYSISHCIDNYVPGLLKIAEAYDVAGLIAPRALFAENGEEDPIFPVAGTRIAFERTQKVYDTLGKKENLGLEVFPGKHEFWGKQGFAFVKSHL
jgi:dienelactone hydrolase